MIPVKLTMEGFLSYHAPVSVDLSQIKVACVSGSNGAGKSTLFDAITWSLFGKARRSDDALIHNQDEQCRVVFTFDYENNRYRVDRTKARGKSTTLEFHVQTTDGGWKPFTEAGVRATEERIQEILGLDYDTFVNASFFLQGKADMFSVQPPGKRKEILSTILGLSVWESYRNEASLRRREAQREYDLQHSLMLDVDNELEQENSRREKLAHEEEMLAVKAELRESKEKLLEIAQQESVRLKSEQEKLKIISAQASELETRIASDREKLQSRQNELQNFEGILSQEDEIIRSHQQYQQVRADLTVLDALGVQYNALIHKKIELAGKIETEKARLEQELQNLQTRKSEVAGLADRQKKMEGEALAAETESAQLQGQIDQIEELEAQQSRKKDLQSEKEGENLQLRKKMDEITERITHLKQASGSDCPLCGQELTETHKHEMTIKLESEGKVFGDTYRENLETIKTCKQELMGIMDEISRLRALRPHLASLQATAGALRQQLAESARAIEDWEKEGAARLGIVQTILQNAQAASELQPELLQVIAEIDALAYSPASHDETRAKEQTLRTVEEKFRMLEQARIARAGLAREIEDLERQQPQSEQNLVQLQASMAALNAIVLNAAEKETELAQLESELREIRMEENQARQNVGAAQQEVNVLDSQRKRKAVLEEAAQQASRQIARLKMLETAFGKDGVPALLIENAIPQIETQANEILDKLSGGNMSVSFETERDYADKKREDRRQTLDIIIRDSAGSRAYELFSGGEAFRINFAIRLALSRVLAQRSGARLQTLVIDEGFGSQDAEGRQRLVEAINLVRDDFEKILVITHLDELKDAFSSRIEVTKTPQGSQVEVIA